MSKATCNHDQLSTEYCPNCGEKLTTAKGSGASLLGYLRNNASKAKNDLEETEEKVDNFGQKQHWINQKRKTLAKWSGWVEFVEDAIAKGSKQ